MPIRSNEFQRLIYLLHHQLHGRAKVTESAMLPDRLGGIAQEIDVLIEETIGQIPMLIAVECRDHQRRATLEWVQQMWGKHQHRVDKLVLVSRSGFTQEALEAARRYGIGTMNLLGAHEADWNVVVNKLKEVFIGRFDFNISRGYAVLDEEYGLEEDPEISVAEPLYSVSDELIGQVGEIAREHLRHPDAGKQLMELFYANQDRKMATARFELPTGSYLIDTSGTKRSARAIKLTVECKLRITPVPLQHGSVGAVHIAWGETRAQDEQLFLVTTEQQEAPNRVTLRTVQDGERTVELVDMIGQSNS